MSKTLVFGASLKPNRYSNYAIQRLVENNHEVVAFGFPDILFNPEDTFKEYSEDKFAVNPESFSDFLEL